jgi:hypothetical protein
MVEPVATPSNVPAGPVAPLSSSMIVGFTDRPYVDWSAVIGGSIIGLGLWMLLTSFGASIGLFLAPPWDSVAPSATTLTIAAAVWFAIVQIFAIATGAYISGRLRQRVDQGPIGEVRFRDGANGLLVWAVGLVAGSILATLLALAGLAAVSDGAGARTSTGSDAAIDRLLRPQTTETGAESASSATITILPRRTRSDVNRDEIARILADGETSDEDKAYLAAIVASRTNMEQEAARARVDTVLAERKEVADNARDYGALAGLWAVAMMLISALAAWWAGALGGSHRDDLE